MENEESLASNTKSVDIKTFIKQTYQLFAGSLLVAATGVYIGIGVLSTISTFFWGLVILEFVLLFGLHWAKHKQGLNLILLFLFTFISGLTAAPFVGHMLASAIGASLVGQAFLMTSVAFGGISIFAMRTKTDFSFMGNFLFIALIIVLVGLLANIFFFHNSVFHLVIVMFSVLLFSAFILYDTQKIIKGKVETPTEGVIALYLNFAILFKSLAQIIFSFNKEE
jgi:modulator of FtsH protease